MNNFFYRVNDEEYEVVVTKKHIRNIHYRYKNGKFYISCPYFVSKESLVQGLNKFASRLLKANSKEEPIGENYIYLFGQKYDLHYPGKFTISNKEVSFSSKEELLKKLVPVFKGIMAERVSYYEKIMNLPSYKVTVRRMKTRLGSNSKHTKTISLSLSLIHFSTPISDSVIVHELAHILVYNHSSKFYEVVYKYCPEYKKYRKMLINGVYHD